MKMKIIKQKLSDTNTLTLLQTPPLPPNTPTERWAHGSTRKPLTIVGDNSVGVVTAVLVDVLYGLIDIIHNLNGTLQSTVFRLQRGGQGWSKLQQLAQPWTGMEINLWEQTGHHQVHKQDKVQHLGPRWKSTCGNKQVIIKSTNKIKFSI